MSTETRYPHVRSALFGTPWAIQPSWMRLISEVVEMRLDGGRPSEREIAERIALADHAGPRGRSSGSRAGNVAVIPIYGVIARHSSVFEDTSTTGTAINSLQGQLRAALGDPEVAGILFDVWSPGGSASGVPELAEEIRGARGQKPMVAISNDLNASAAYWLSSQVDELVVSPHSFTGSIGVVMAHEDWTAAEEMAGIKTTLIYAGDHKVETYPETPLSKDAEAYMQSLVDDTYGMFLKAAADGRGVSIAKVKADFGQGRVLTAKQAVAAGMADRVGTYEDTILRLSSGKVQMRAAAATIDVEALERAVETQQAAEPLVTQDAIAAADMVTAGMEDDSFVQARIRAEKRRAEARLV